MRRFHISQSKTETFTSHSGLALVGLALSRSGLDKKLRTVPHRHGIDHFDCAGGYVGLLCIGKSDFDAIENRREDRCFRQSLRLKKVPCASSLRQRFDHHAQSFIPLVDTASIDMIAALDAPVTPLWTGHIALDMDVFPMDNSKTKKEHVARTYKGHDGYAPMAAYLGNEGWCLACELRKGSQHCQSEFVDVLERVVPRARRLTGKPLLARLDGGHDAVVNRFWLKSHDVDFIIKWNPRKQDKEAWLKRGREIGTLEEPREGKKIYTFCEQIEEHCNGQSHIVRRVVRVIERRIDKHGQKLLIPEIKLEGWWTSLSIDDCTNDQIIRLYQDHATSEQFHSEFKTDLDVERLPSGKFDTNDLVMALAVLSYNILRWIGLIGLLGEISPVRHPAKRRRLRTVMQELICLAARVVESGRRLVLRFSKHCPGFAAFEATYNKLAAV